MLPRDPSITYMQSGQLDSLDQAVMAYRHALFCGRMAPQINSRSLFSGPRLEAAQAGMLLARYPVAPAPMSCLLLRLHGRARQLQLICSASLFQGLMKPSGSAPILSAPCIDKACLICLSTLILPCQLKIILHAVTLWHWSQ